MTDLTGFEVKVNGMLAVFQSLVGLQPIGHPLYGLAEIERQSIPVTEYLAIKNNIF